MYDPEVILNMGTVGSGSILNERIATLLLSTKPKIISAKSTYSAFRMVVHSVRELPTFIFRIGIWTLLMLPGTSGPRRVYSNTFHVSPSLVRSRTQRENNQCESFKYREYIKD